MVSVVSLSKSEWAGVRVGWLRAERPLLSRVAAAMSREHGAMPVLDQLAAWARTNLTVEQCAAEAPAAG